jgi:nucleoside-diphosphate-sugar epimerase
VAANLLAAVAEGEVSGRAFNVAAGVAWTVAELARTVADAVGGEVPPPAHAPPRPGDVRHSLADLEASRRLLGYAPSRTLAQGLAETAEHYRRGAATG